MLKDYFDSTLSQEHQAVIDDFLAGVPRSSVFSSYGQARSYRSSDFYYKDEHGRYKYRIFLYNGFYYVASLITFSHLKWLIARFRQIEAADLRFKSFIDYTSNELARDGVSVPKDLFNNEVI